MERFPEFLFDSCGEIQYRCYVSTMGIWLYNVGKWQLNSENFASYIRYIKVMAVPQKNCFLYFISRHLIIFCLYFVGSQYHFVPDHHYWSWYLALSDFLQPFNGEYIWNSFDRLRHCDQSSNHHQEYLYVSTYYDYPCTHFDIFYWLRNIEKQPLRLWAIKQQYRIRQSYLGARTWGHFQILKLILFTQLE